MNYMINVDMESPNVSGGGTDCRSKLHENLGLHFDLTVHALGCSSRGNRAVHRPPSRYWDDNSGEGYTLEEVINRLAELQSLQPDVYLRRCRSCKVDANLPYWD